MEDRGFSFAYLKATYDYLLSSQGDAGMEPNQSRRTWSTPVRDKWNAPIHQILKAIDNHVDLYILTGDPWHMDKAEDLRLYLHELKTFIHKNEGR